MYQNALLGEGMFWDDPFGLHDGLDNACMEAEGLNIKHHMHASMKE